MMSSSYGWTFGAKVPSRLSLAQRASAWDKSSSELTAAELEYVGSATRKQRLEQAQELESLHKHPDQSKIVHAFPNGWSMREMQTLGDLHREGELMSNCMRASETQDVLPETFNPEYWPYIKKYEDLPEPPAEVEHPFYEPYHDSTGYKQYGVQRLDLMPWHMPIKEKGRYFSLRDPDNLPHVTVDHQTEEVLGRHNSVPKPEHQDLVNHWETEEFGDPLYPDLARVGSAKDELHVGLDIPKQAATEINQWVHEQEWPEGTELLPIDEYHITMLFCQGEGSSEHREDDWTHKRHAVSITGLREFPPSEERNGLHPVVLLVKGDTLRDHHEVLLDEAEDKDLDAGDYTRSKYKPHITVAYTPGMPDDLKPPKMTFETSESKVSKPRETEEDRSSKEYREHHKDDGIEAKVAGREWICPFCNTGEWEEQPELNNDPMMCPNCNTEMYPQPREGVYDTLDPKDLPEGGLWHMAPTTERARIKQHGLIPSRPSNNPRWRGDEYTRGVTGIERQPEGVYGVPNQQFVEAWGDPGSHDLWYIPHHQIRQLQADPLVEALSVPHRVDNPELHGPAETYWNEWLPEHQKPRTAGEWLFDPEGMRPDAFNTPEHGWSLFPQTCPQCHEQYDVHKDDPHFGDYTRLCPKCREQEWQNTDPNQQTTPAHPDPWMDNEPGTLTIPEHWSSILKIARLHEATDSWKSRDKWPDPLSDLGADPERRTDAPCWCGDPHCTVHDPEEPVDRTWRTVASWLPEQRPRPELEQAIRDYQEMLTGPQGAVAHRWGLITTLHHLEKELSEYDYQTERREQEHISRETLPQQVKRWQENRPHPRSGESEVVHEFPDGWTVQHHPTMFATWGVGKQMNNCWQGQRVTPNLRVRRNMALHDENDIPRVAFYLLHPQWFKQPDDSPWIVGGALRHHNKPIVESDAQMLEQYANTNGYQPQYIRRTMEDPLEDMRATIGEPVNLAHVIGDVWKLSTENGNSDSRRYQDTHMLAPPVPNVTEGIGSEPRGCTCGEDHKLDCPVHGLYPSQPDPGLEWSVAEGSPVGWHQENYTKGGHEASLWNLPAEAIQRLRGLIPSEDEDREALLERRNEIPAAPFPQGEAWEGQPAVVQKARLTRLI